MLAPKPPPMPSAPAPVMEQDLDQEEAVFNPGSELDDMAMATETSSNKQGKSSLKTHDTGLAIPL